MHGAESVIVGSLTKTAATEIANKKVDGHTIRVKEEHVTTLHGLCWRQMKDGRRVAEDHLKEWNEEYGYSSGYPMKVKSSGKWNPEHHRPEGRSPKELRGDEQKEKLSEYRQRMTPRDAWGETHYFATVWEKWKEQHGYADFDDMIQYGATMSEPPFGARLGVFDEAQDFSRLEWNTVKHWASMMEHILVSGDDHQCQPGYTEIATSKGSIRIADLREDTHKLLSFDRHDKAVYGARNGGYGFKIAARPYLGPLIRVSTEGKTTTCTPNHHWLVKWSEQAKKTGACVVYLMRRGQHFRVGWCHLFSYDPTQTGKSTFNFAMRARIEQADAAWILRVFPSKVEASFYESEVSIRYGIPTPNFQEHPDSSKIYVQHRLDAWFTHMHTVLPIHMHAIECLADHGRDVRFPLWSGTLAEQKHGGSSIFLLHACNFIDGFLEVPTYLSAKDIQWEPAHITEESYRGEVFSLDVEKLHTYVANGIVTHNCLYSWRGADPGELIHMTPEPIRSAVLPRSFRLPRRIMDYCERWAGQLSDRMPRHYEPREEGGSVSETGIKLKNTPRPLLELCERALVEKKRLLILTACQYQLTSILEELKREGIPFGNRWRPAAGAWNPLGDRGHATEPGKWTPFGTKKRRSTVDQLLDYYSPRKNGALTWTVNELKRWVPLLEVQKNLTHGAKKEIDALPLSDSPAPLGDIVRWFTPSAMQYLVEKIDPVSLCYAALSEKRRLLEYPAHVLARRGIEAIEQEPLVQVGTIHSVKGGTTDWCLIFPDLSPQGYDDWRQWNVPSQRDSVIRQFYVALSRAREKVFLAQPSGSQAIHWL